MKGKLSSIGTKIREMRKDKGWTLADLSGITGISPSHISAIERGTSDFTVTNLLLLSEAFQVLPEQFFIGEIQQVKAYHHVMYNAVSDCNLPELQIMIDLITSVKKNLRKYQDTNALHIM